MSRRVVVALFVLASTSLCLCESSSSPPTRDLYSNGTVSPLYVSVDGNDAGDCSSPTSPCGSLLYAVEVIAAAITPLSDMVPIQMGPGQYPSSSCGVISNRPLSIVGAGALSTIVNCGRTSSLLTTSSSVSMSSLTVVDCYNSGNGGAVSVQYSGSPYYAAIGITSTFTDVVIINCTSADNGGGLSVVTSGDSGSVVTLNGVRIEECVAGISGACCAWCSNDSLIVRVSTIQCQY